MSRFGGKGGSVLVSVIVPALNEADHIGACIRAVLCGGEGGSCYAPSQVEVIVVDGGSSDGTPSLVPEGVTVVTAPRGRGVQMNRGGAAALGQILVFCHADTRLPAGWREDVVTALERPGVSGGAFQVAYQPARGFLHVINRHHLRGSAWWAVHGDRAQFMTRETFDATGGYPEIVLMEDVEMARALHRRGRIVMVPRRVIASSRRFVERGPLFQYVLSLWCLTRYLWFGATPEESARLYRSSREGYVQGPAEAVVSATIRGLDQAEEGRYG